MAGAHKAISGRPQGGHPARQLLAAGRFWLFSPPVACAGFVLFVLATFLMGGGSRADLASLPVLRPLAIMLGLYGLLALRAGALAGLGPLYGGLALLALLIGWQLVMLPFAWWEALPGRQVYAEAAALAGVAGGWRPASLAPSGTWNALFALWVPLGGLLLFSALAPVHRACWPRVVLGLGVGSALLGFVQLAGPAGSALYLYRITNDAEAVGLFANRNHHAVFLAALIPVAAWCARAGFGPRGARAEPLARRQALFAGLVLLLLIGVLATGSRAGLICAALMLGCASLMLFLVPEPGLGMGAARRGAAFARRVQRWFWLSPLLLGGLGVLAGGLASRGTGIDRLSSADGLSGLRVQVLPTLLEMMAQFLPLGAGFGSFAQVYPRFERDALLRPEYLNQAHNDWLQTIIEGGVPALAALALALWWLGARLIRGWRSGIGGEARLGLLCAGAVWLCLGVASLVDYPLRVPSLMLFALLATTPLCLAVRAGAGAGASAGAASGEKDALAGQSCAEPCVGPS